MGVIPLTSILSHKGRGGYLHLPVAPHRDMKTRNDRVLEKCRTMSLTDGRLGEVIRPPLCLPLTKGEKLAF